MFESNFTHSSSTALPPTVDLSTALRVLHDFEAVVKLSPDCRACKRIPAPPAAAAAKNGGAKTSNGDSKLPSSEMQYWEVEDDLPFIPKRLWAGGVRYTADFVPTADGCIITVYAPGGFVSTNHWRILHEVVPEDKPVALEPVAQSKDILHVERGMGGEYHVQIVSKAKCPMAFVTFVRGFLKNSHTQLQLALIEKIKSMDMGEGQRKRRPTIGRRRSSEV